MLGICRSYSQKFDCISNLTHRYRLLYFILRIKPYILRMSQVSSAKAPMAPCTTKYQFYLDQYRFFFDQYKI